MSNRTKVKLNSSNRGETLCILHNCGVVHEYDACTSVMFVRSGGVCVIIIDVVRCMRTLGEDCSSCRFSRPRMDERTRFSLSNQVFAIVGDHTIETVSYALQRSNKKIRSKTVLISSM